MNASILVTGANAGLGKETARQLALKPETKRIILGCRNPQKAAVAKAELEAATGKNIFEILLMDVSEVESSRQAAMKLEGKIDALILNAGGMGGKVPEKMTSSGMISIAATNILGHAVFVEELIQAGKIRNVIVLSTSEAARGFEKIGIRRPALPSNSVEEMSSILNGNYFGRGYKSMEIYGHVKYVATLWMSSMARKHPSLRFVSISPGSTSGTSATDNSPPALKFLYNYIMMPVVLPLFGMVHKIEQGAARYIDAISNDKYQSGGYYASREKKVVGEVVDQFKFFPDMANPTFQDNAWKAIHRYT